MVVCQLSHKSLPSIDVPLALSDVSRHSTIPAAGSRAEGGPMQAPL
jgi:hypothetical protein